MAVGNGKRRRIRLAAVACAAAFACALLSSCAFFSQDEDMSNVRSIGEPTTVSCQFNFIFLFNRGPYEITITPVDLVRLYKDGDPYDCVQVEYRIDSTGEEDSAEFATSTVAMNFVSSTMEEIGWNVWWQDPYGTQVDVQRATLEQGETYTFYVPLKDTFDKVDFKYIAVADRSGWWQRGTTYWYEIPDEPFAEAKVLF